MINLSNLFIIIVTDSNLSDNLPQNCMFLTNLWCRLRLTCQCDLLTLNLNTCMQVYTISYKFCIDSQLLVLVKRKLVNILRFRIRLE